MRTTTRFSATLLGLLAMGLACGPTAHGSVSATRPDSIARPSPATIPGGTLDQLPALPWRDAVRHGDIMYFTFGAPARIERYNLAGGAWLAPLALGAAPTAIAVADDAVYVAYGKRVVQMGLDGMAEVHVRNSQETIDGLAVIDRVLLVKSGQLTLSIDRTSFALIDQTGSLSNAVGLAVAPNLRRVFGREPGFVFSSNRLYSVAVDAGGKFVDPLDSGATNGDTERTHAFVAPGEKWVFDDSGNIYTLPELERTAGLGGPVESMGFYGDLPVVLRAGNVIAYDNTWSETGRFHPLGQPLAIQVLADTVFVFGADEARGVAATSFPVGKLSPAVPGQPVDPTGLHFVPDALSVVGDELVLLSRAHLSLFRWSIKAHRFLATLPLRESPRTMTVDAPKNKLYLGYRSGRITELVPGSPPTEKAVMTVGGPLLEIASLGDALLVLNGERSTYISSEIHDWNGRLLASTNLLDASAVIWHAQRRRLYWFVSLWQAFAWQEVRPDWSFGDAKDSISIPSDAVRPNRLAGVSPDGRRLLGDDGRIYDADSLFKVDTLTNAVERAVWHAGGLVTLRTTDDGGELQLWGDRYALSGSTTLTGKPLWIGGLKDGELSDGGPIDAVLVVMQREGMPWVSIRRADGGLGSIYDAPVPPPLNDNRAAAVVVDKLPFTDSHDVSTATDEAGEAKASCAAAEGSGVWYRLQPTGDGEVEVNTAASGFDTVVSAWSRRDDLSFREIACNDNFGARKTSRLKLSLVIGQPVWIKASGVGPATGLLKITFRLPVVENDDLADATPVESLPFEQTGANLAATNEPGEAAPACSSSATGSSWYRLTLPTDSRVRILVGDNISGWVISAWQGSAHPLDPVDCSTSGQLTVTAAAGRPLWIKLESAYGQMFSSKLKMEVPPSPPSNDALQDAFPIVTLPFSRTVDTRPATTEPNEAASSCASSGSHGVWYRYRASVDGRVRLQATSRDQIATVSAWTGSDHPLTEVQCASNTDADYPAVFVLRVKAGGDYFIRVESSYSGSGGDMRLQAEIPPPSPANDDLDAAANVTGLPFHDSVDLTGSDEEPGEARASCTGFATHSVWYRVVFTTTTAVGIVARSSDSGYSLSAWTGTTHPLAPLVCDSDSGSAARIKFVADAGKAYFVKVEDAGFSALPRPGFQVDVDMAATTAPATNDDFGAALAVRELPFEHHADTLEATKEAGEPVPDCVDTAGRSVWYTYAPTRTAEVHLDTQGSDFDTVIGLWTGWRFPLKPIACNDDAGRVGGGGGGGGGAGGGIENDYTSALTYKLTAGTTYFIQVSGVGEDGGEGGDLHFHMRLAQPPANDALANAARIDGLPFHAAADTVDATSEPNEAGPSCAGRAAKGVWYQLVLGQSVAVRLATEGSAFDTVLSVWEGAQHPLTEVACNDDAQLDVAWSALTIQAEAGRTYWVKAEGLYGQGGALRVSVAKAPGAPKARGLGWAVLPWVGR